MHLRAGCVLSQLFRPAVCRVAPLSRLMQATKQPDVGQLVGSAGQELHYERVLPTSTAAPGILLLNGLLSDMTGRKALLLKEVGQQMGVETVLFDYRGHGKSPGVFQELGLGDWLADTLCIFDQVVTSQQVVLVGSSLGGWLALLVAQRRPQRVAGLVLIAPAVDISEYHWQGLSPEVQAAALRCGLVPLHSPYVSTTGQEGQTVMPQEGTVMLGLPFFIQASKLLVLQHSSGFMQQFAEHTGGVSSEHTGPANGWAIQCPLTVLHGDADDVVPVAISHSLLAAAAAGTGVVTGAGGEVRDAQGDVCTYKSFRAATGCLHELHVIAGGDHRLSGPAELLLLQQMVQNHVQNHVCRAT